MPSGEQGIKAVTKTLVICFIGDNIARLYRDTNKPLYGSRHETIVHREDMNGGGKGWTFDGRCW